MTFDYFVVGLGGALGAILRLALVKILPAAIMGVPVQIFFVNVMGCFLMGCLTAFLTTGSFISDSMKTFLAAGFLGGFTTFSAFAFEFGMLYEKQLYVSALLYVLLSFVLSLSLFFIGLKVVRIFLY